MAEFAIITGVLSHVSPKKILLSYPIQFLLSMRIFL